MQAKKDLARRIVADFHSAESATKAAEDWAKQFQKDQVPDAVESISIPLVKVNAVNKDLPNTLESSYFPLDDPQLPDIRLVWFSKVLVEAGLATSRGEATRKIEEKAVRANDKTVLRDLVTIQLRAEKVVKLGKKLKKLSIVG